MNENIDLIKILKDCPNEWNLWSPLFGDVKFLRIFGNYIEVIDKIGTQAYFNKSGKYITTYDTIGCMLFPSKDQMEWRKFTAPWYKKDKLVEPKFKVGNWYKCTKDFFGRGVTFHKNNSYYCAKEMCLQDEYGCNITIFKDLYDNFKLWTIQDVKDGDIIQLGTVTAIFKKYIGEEKCICYCSFCEDTGFEIPIENDEDNVYGCYNATPATKEQCDLLFQKMKEAYYEWDVNKKELKLVKPKFKVGDWIITPTNNVLQITSIEGRSYKFNNKSHYWAICYCDEQCRFWTIKDAKDGDVLCCKSGWMCIFKALNNHTNAFSSYCFMDSDKCFFNIGIDGHTLDKKFINAYNGEIYPATKEQRDSLMKAMNDAGYKWDAETKTLEKLV